MNRYISTCPDCGFTRKINIQTPARRCRPCTNQLRNSAPKTPKPPETIRECGHLEADMVVRPDGKRHCLPCKIIREKGRDYALRQATRVTLPLPPPPTRPKWNEAAACFEMDTDIFYPTLNESSRPAKKICITCPIRLECLSWAMEHMEYLGVWGGLTPDERKRLRVKMNREVAA